MTKIDYKLKEIDFKLADEHTWDGYLAHHHRLHRENFPSYPPENPEVRRKQILADDPYYVPTRYLIWVDDKIIGYAFLGHSKEGSPDYESNGHIAEIHISIDQEYRQKGIGGDILQKLLTDAREKKKTVAQIWTSNPDGKMASKNWGFEMTHEHFVNKLMFSEIDWDLMQQWIDESKKRAKGVSIENFTDVPEEIIEDYTKLYTEIYGQAPWGAEGEMITTPEMRREQEKRFKKQDIFWFTMISREPNGEISGLTEILYNSNDPENVEQELTGVVKKYRGRGLGKWLKAEMAFHIKNNFPRAEFVSTGNAMKNAPMLSINRQMGFKEICVFHMYTKKL